MKAAHTRHELAAAVNDAAVVFMLDFDGQGYGRGLGCHRVAPSESWKAREKCARQACAAAFTTSGGKTMPSEVAAF